MSGMLMSVRMASNLWCGSVLRASNPLAASTISRSYDSLPNSRMVVRYARMDEESSTTRTFIWSAPRLLRREHRVSERVAGLGEEDFQSRHPFDRRAMLGVVAVQNTNRPVDVHDRKRHYLRW